ncbi:hypothetical protein [Spiroplasma endosymbiont of Panorpa germanica]|uniref:aldose epimerase family protein n=1 Tax=Spiroplasma endosymbiont of Panorpa germanica TaxID=3066314 RepID=UPI0030CD1050
MYKLENKDIKVTIDKNNMEIRSIKKGSKEFTYQHSNSWQKNWPILFPICGTLKNNNFTHKDKVFTLPRHGFFRDLSNWEIKNESEGQVTFSTKSGKKFIEQYPFEFEIDFQVKIEESSLKTNFIVKNLSKETMFFSFGYHPAFLIKQEGCLTFSKKEIFYTDNEDMLYLKRNPENKFDFTKVQIKDINFKGSQFYWSDQLQSDFVEYQDDEKSFKINLQKYPVCLLWSEDNKSDYICIEPWFGSADFNDRKDNFISNKDNILSLEPNQIWNDVFTMELK